MKYDAVVIEHLRITLLRLLEEQPGRVLNESILGDMSEGYGFAPSRDRLRTELRWLEEQGLVNLAGEACLVATLTERGEDVARCRVMVPGVKRPSPRR
ncbi:ArsR family transcriptional regulator [Desulfocurvibacter africanus]|uniref:VpaChn25_0724 family phage protein n=1 Tax=Desulfocurvibacter africanus TaxID=873 RepID=UPI002FDA4721